MKMNAKSPVAGHSCGRLLVVSLGLLAITAVVIEAASLLPPGKPAPELSLKTLEGKTVGLADLKDRMVLLLFGELYNGNSVAACKDLAAVLAKPAISGIKVSAFLVITQQAPAADLISEAGRQGVTLPILHDDGRRTFAGYHVLVLPSLVIIDGKGQTVLACAGYPLDFADMVSDSLLVAAGSISAREFDRRRTPATMPAAPEGHIRALRLAALGEQLVNRGSEELAISSFRDAIALDPNCVSARVGLGTCLLSRKEIAEGEKQFLHVLGINPDSVEAAVGLVHVELIRGGSELKSAEEHLRVLLRKRPNDPKVVYLAGLVAEKSGDASAALGHYKRAAELLLYGQQQRWELK